MAILGTAIMGNGPNRKRPFWELPFWERPLWETTFMGNGPFENGPYGKRPLWETAILGTIFMGMAILGTAFMARNRPVAWWLHTISFLQTVVYVCSVTSVQSLYRLFAFCLFIGLLNVTHSLSLYWPQSGLFQGK